MGCGGSKNAAAKAEKKEEKEEKVGVVQDTAPGGDAVNDAKAEIYNKSAEEADAISVAHIPEPKLSAYVPEMESTLPAFLHDTQNDEEPAGLDVSVDGTLADFGDTVLDPIATDFGGGLEEVKEKTIACNLEAVKEDADDAVAQ